MAGRIEDYALVGDMQTAALVGRDGSVDWLCLPRFDSPAVFCGLLGDDANGFWRIAPAGGPAHAVRRRYRGGSLILESEWDTRDGTVRLTDFMPPRGRAPRLVRIVEGVCGRVAVRSALRMRFSYGRVVPWARKTAGRLAAVAGPDSLWLDTDVETHGSDLTTYSDFTLGPGEQAAFTLSWQASHLPPPPQRDVAAALRATDGFWADWVGRCTYDGPWRDAVVRSLITLKALTYRPTGGVVAAPTASLPEELGGVRNWDYRYTWLRDAALTLSVLLNTGYREEAEAWRSWLLRAVAGDPQNLQIMYGVAGERELPEAELLWLPGYEGSAPVRVGNAAAGQFQLDVFGEVMDALYLGERSGLPPTDDIGLLRHKLMNHLETRWREPDEGIWEIRGPRRHFVHSKVMAWVAADRIVRLLERHDRAGHAVRRWQSLRETIHREVCALGWDPQRRTFTQSYGSKELDASLLLIPQVGFLPPDDPRVAGTVEAIRRELLQGGFVARYPTRHSEIGVDGLPGGEGAFLVCSFWLADALAAIGRRDEARELFERLLALRNDVGLLAEEWDCRAGRQLGNFPQAFSHIGLVNTALALGG
ncbi:glycoside hydrolase family 15 protein [Streptomyces sp. RB6PN25]|uniref:Glycoside hydrolase family 15 protein n=1 Tax=Streptomyces humicola TaxID=2953240 RepID=A0ABT1Q1L3_9ACTN|nr:glycoside hydrolase family 15 protein [Streptomyces humicola]MCQ4083784.1 glycoside hydrolase family 15 protein [Streptomyces humicola]